MIDKTPHGEIEKTIPDVCWNCEYFRIDYGCTKNIEEELYKNLFKGIYYEKQKN